MSELRQKAIKEPRAKRCNKKQIKKLQAVYNVRNYPWPGDKMILKATTGLTKIQVKSWFEQQARMYKKKNGHQQLSNIGSNRSAQRMWAAHDNNEGEYVRKLKKGIISLKTGEVIKGDSSQHPESALKPGNGYIRNTSAGDTTDDDTDGDTDEDNNESTNEGSDGGFDNDAYVMGYDVGNGPDSYNEYGPMAASPQYPTKERGIPRYKGQMENDINHKSSFTSGTIGNIQSQVGFNQSHSNFDKPYDGHSGKHPEPPHGYDGSQSKANFSNYNSSVDTQNTLQHDEHMLGAAQPSSYDTRPDHIDTMHMNFQSNPLNRLGGIADKSLDEREERRYRQKETSAVAILQTPEKRADHVGREIQKDEKYGYVDINLRFPASSNKRKGALLEEGIIGVRPSKRQHQPEGRLEWEHQMNWEQQLKKVDASNKAACHENGPRTLGKTNSLFGATSKNVISTPTGEKEDEAVKPIRSSRYGSNLGEQPGKEEYLSHLAKVLITEENSSFWYDNIWYNQVACEPVGEVSWQSGHLGGSLPSSDVNPTAVLDSNADTVNHNHNYALWWERFFGNWAD